MTNEIRTKKLENEITSLIKARSAEFSNSDDTEYKKINRRLNWKRAELQRIYNYNAVARHMGRVPSSPEHYGYTRYETISSVLVSRIHRMVHPVTAAWVYFTDNKIAKNLKDAVAYCEA